MLLRLACSNQSERDDCTHHAVKGGWFQDNSREMTRPKLRLSEVNLATHQIPNGDSNQFDHTMAADGKAPGSSHNNTTGNIKLNSAQVEQSKLDPKSPHIKQVNLTTHSNLNKETSICKKNLLARNRQMAGKIILSIFPQQALFSSMAVQPDIRLTEKFYLSVVTFLA